jgi:hypothetical protein
MNSLKFKKIERTTLIVLVVIFGLISLYLTGFLFRIYGDKPNQFMEHSFGGVVVINETDHITVRDGRGLTRSFIVVPETKVLKGRDEVALQTLTPDTYVLVENKPIDGVRNEAITIRVISEGKIPHMNKKHE